MVKDVKLAFNLHGLLLLYVAGAWLVGIFLASFVTWPALWFLLGVAGGLVLLALCWRNLKRRLVVLLICCLLLGAWRYATATLRDDPQSIARFVGNQPWQILGTVTDEPKFTGHSRLLIVTVQSLSRDNQKTVWSPAHGQIEVLVLGTGIEDPYGANYGDVIELSGKLQGPWSYSMPGTLATMVFPRVSVEESNTASPIAILYHFRLMLANTIERALPQPKEAALLVAIFLSVRTSALEPALPYFNETGIAHLIAPSGFKVTMLAGLIGRSMAGFHEERSYPMLVQQRVVWRSWLATVLKVVSIGIYTVLNGTGPAAIRAGVMGTLLVIAPLLGRRYNVYTALAATALVMSAIQPYVLWDASFQLSFLGTLGIVLLTPPLQRLLRPLTRIPAGHYLMEIVAVTLAAQIATWPIIAITFQIISLVAPLTNLLTVPFFGLIIVLGLCVCCAGLISMLQLLATVLGWIARPILWYVDWAAHWSSQLPHAFFPVNSGAWVIWAAWYYYVLLMLVLIFLWRRGTLQEVGDDEPLPSFLTLSPRIWRRIQVGGALLAIIITVVNGPIAQPGMLKITFLHVTPDNQPLQGDTIVIRTADGKTILIDGGLDGASLSQALDPLLPLWHHSLDAVILTAAEQDHITGLQDIIQRYAVSTVIDAGMLHPNVAYTRWRSTIRQANLRYFSVAQGTTIPLGIGVSLQILWPGQPLHKSSNEERDNALVMCLIAPGLRILLLGVAAQSKYALNGLLNTSSSNYLQAQIVQMVGENKTLFPVELNMVLQRAKPSLLLMTSGAPSGKQRKAGGNTMLGEDTLSTLTQANWQVIQTAQVGTREISSSKAGWSLSTEF